MPVGEENGDVAAGALEPLQHVGSDDVADVELAGRLEPDVGPGVILGLKERLQLPFGYDFGRVVGDEVDAAVGVQDNPVL
jgi:hypothetical protein